MKTLLRWFLWTVILVCPVIGLALAIRQETAERQALEIRVAAAKTRLTQLRARAGRNGGSSPFAGVSPVANPASASGTASAASAEAARAEAEGRQRQAASNASAKAARSSSSSASADEFSRLQAERNRRQFRMNALTGYDTGFEALHIPAAVVASAKEVIVNGYEAMLEARKPGRSPEEATALATSAKQAMDAQLVGLLGADVADQLAAYKQDSHFDWTIGTDMWDGRAPLSPDQVHALSLAVRHSGYKEQFWGSEPSSTQAPGPATGLSSQDLALLAAARDFLSPIQQEILRQNLLDDNRYNAAMRGFRAKQRALWTRQ